MLHWVNRIADRVDALAKADPDFRELDRQRIQAFWNIIQTYIVVLPVLLDSIDTDITGIIFILRQQKGGF